MPSAAGCSPAPTDLKKLNGRVPGGRCATPTLDEIDIVASHDGDAVLAATSPPGRGVLVVGMGDESRGDGGIGVHLARCLAQLPWPDSVVFCPADESLPARAEKYARVILLDAMEGPDTPGSLYEADPEDILARSVGGPGSGLGLLGMLPKAMLKRTSVFGVQPGTTTWGAGLSLDVICCMPMLVPYLRASILRAAAEVQQVN